MTNMLRDLSLMPPAERDERRQSGGIATAPAEDVCRRNSPAVPPAGARS
jgi:hypothetical protein